MFEELINGILRFRFHLFSYFDFHIELNVLTTILLLLVIYMIVRKFGKKLNFFGQLVIVTYIIYIMFVIAATGIFNFDPVDIQNYDYHIQLRPFNFLLVYERIGFNDITLGYFKSYIYNFIMLMPLSFYLVVIYKNLSLKIVTFYAYLTSMIIEMIQLTLLVYGLNYRIFNIDDIILNTLGAVIGYIIIKPIVLITRINIYKSNIKGKKQIKYKYIYFSCFITILTSALIIYKINH